MEKYKTLRHFLVAKLYKDIKRYRISKLLSWKPLSPLESGCTAIIAMCSKMPYVLGANLDCLNKNQWKALKEVLITVDAEKGALPDGFEEDILHQFSQLNITFLYYNHQQAKLSAKISDSFIYSWLSWSICLNHVRTKTVLIHDYDALVLSGKAFEKRYQAFLESGAKIQGITWYKANGFVTEDHLATTFETFADVNWIRSFPPVMGYNKVAIFKKRKVDYDTYLDIQANYTPIEQRTVMPMSIEEVVHPSQMITQYMNFRNTPGKRLPCFAVTMIPFFYFLSGQKEAIINAIKALQQSNLERIDLLSDGVLMNFYLLDTKLVNLMLKLMVQALIGLEVKPFKALIEYGIELYRITQTPPEQVWVSDFTDIQREFILSAKNLN